MKKLLLLIAFISFFSIQSQAQIDLDEEMMNGSTLMLQPGLILVYEVDFYDFTYDFLVHIKSFEEGIEFNYEMTNDENTSGTVKISKEAFESATAQKNFFSGGEMNLTDQTTVWLSKKVFMDLVEKGTATISPDGGTTTGEIKVIEVGHNYDIYNAINDETMDDISYIFAESPDGSWSYVIHLSKYNPLILEMDLKDWSLWLKEIRKEK